MVTKDPKTSEAAPEHRPTRATEFGFIPIPKRLRYDPSRPFHFGLLLNISFGFACTFVIANLYYCQPLLIELAKSFDVSYNEVSRIPTMVQAGYATGIIFLTPLGDIVRRRQLVLFSLFVALSFTIGLAVTGSLFAFEVLSFFVGVFTITPQILMPLASDLAPPEHRASALSVVLSGLMLGVLLARVLAGVMGQFTTWRVVYYIAIGLQSVVLIWSYFLIPDYPPKNDDLTYVKILATMAKYAVTEPVLIQACLAMIASSACFANYWVTLTFLLGGPPYNYSTVVIGLFGLVGMFGVILGPVVGRLIDKLVPWYATLIAMLCLLGFQAIQTALGGLNITAVIIACVGLDLFRQMEQVSLSKSVFMISGAATSRLNAVFMMSIFVAQVMGTSVGTKVFLESGWRASAGLNMAFYLFQICVLLLRGPHCERYTWFGYQGGIEPRKKVVEEHMRREKDSESAAAAGEKGLDNEEKVDVYIGVNEDKMGGDSGYEKDVSGNV